MLVDLSGRHLSLTTSYFKLTTDVQMLWGNVSSQIHLISPGCPRPNSALTVHKSGLKHRSSIHPSKCIKCRHGQVPQFCYQCMIRSCGNKLMYQHVFAELLHKNFSPLIRSYIANIGEILMMGWLVVVKQKTRRNVCMSVCAGPLF